MTTDAETCVICRRSLDWHRYNETAHKFSPMGQVGALDKTFGPRKKEEAPSLPRKGGPDVVRVQEGLPQDPVLRLVLLRKGIITLEELAETEKEVRDAKQRGAGVVFISSPGPADPEFETEAELRHARELARERHPSQRGSGDGQPVRVGDESSPQGSMWPDS